METASVLLGKGRTVVWDVEAEWVWCDVEGGKAGVGG